MSSIGRPPIGQVGGGTTAASPPAPGWVTLRSRDGRHVLTAPLAADDPTVDGGRGGWEAAKRPRKPGIVQWTGSDVATATVSVLLDGWADDESVEPSLRVVDGLAPPNPVTEPQSLTVVGAPEIPATTPWVVQDVSFTDRLRRDSDGATARVTVTFTLLEYRPGDVVIVKSDPAKRSVSRNGGGTNAGRAKQKTYTVRKGDTLGGIAARLLGSAAKWKTIASKNGIRNPNALRVGQVLKLP